jgi:hypothetical protein
MTFGLLRTAVSALAANRNVTPSALMFSDTHFNPFHDPASGWETIFASVGGTRRTTLSFRKVTQKAL